MGGILLKGFVPNMKAKNVYEVLFKFEDFCNHSNVIKKIDVIDKKPDGTSRFSSWEVEIEGKGLLRWTERDELDSQKLKITFEKTEGDIEILSGSWEVIEELDGASIQFEAMYSFGIEMLEDILDPIAGEMLEDTISQVLKGLFQDIVLDPAKKTTTVKEGE